MTLAAHKEGLVADLSDGSFEVLDSEIKKFPESVMKGERVKASGYDVDKLDKVEKLALSMLDDKQTYSFAIDNSILRNEEEVEKIRNFHWIYYITFPFAIILSIFVMFRITVYRFFHWNYKDSDDLKKQERFVLGPIKPLSMFLDKLNPIAYAFRQGVTGSVSLDLGYNFTETVYNKSNKFGDLVTRYWFNIPDAVGSRNRLKMTYTNLLNELERQYSLGNKSVRLVSLACGSAQATIEAVAKFKSFHSDVEVFITLIDLSSPSLKRASLLAKSRGIFNNIDILRENIKEHLPTLKSNSIDIVEMVGFLDYRNTRSIISISKEIRRILKDDGLYLTAIICPSFFSFVLRWAGGWPFLIRRTKEEFETLIVESGFLNSKDIYQYDTTKTFCVASCYK